jgi:tol-pal system protein YbgF
MTRVPGTAATLSPAVLSLLLLAGCASDPYWSRTDREAAERRDAAERAARAAVAPPPVAPIAADPPPPSREPVPAPPVDPEPEPSTAVDSAPLPRSAPRIDESDLEELSAPAGAGGAGAIAPGAEPIVTEAVQAEYDAALDRLQRGEGEAAEAAFRAFLARHAATELGDNAQYWLAESLLRRGQTEPALVEFRAVVERYPTGNKVPDALWKIGRALEELGDATLAREVFDELVSRFPQSSAAEQARGRRAADGPR